LFLGKKPYYEGRFSPLHKKDGMKGVRFRGQFAVFEKTRISKERLPEGSKKGRRNRGRGRRHKKRGGSASIPLNLHVGALSRAM